ncbi:hypothetical protein R70199_03639 [Paraburkholderia domus]|nr:hypothetical protein R70199_03639 [Paraburkholderia domus]
MKRFALLAAVPVLLAACATPPGEFKDTDFTWEETTVAATPPQVFRGVMERVRRCGSFENLVADGQYYPDISEQTIDLYGMGGWVHVSTGYIFGKLTISATADGKTLVRAGVQPKYTRGLKPAELVRSMADPQRPCSS